MMDDVDEAASFGCGMAVFIVFVSVAVGLSYKFLKFCGVFA